MRKLTVAERRKRELRFAAERYNIPYDELKHLMNRFYRLNGALEKYGLCLDYFGHLATICETGTTRTAIEAIYYE